MAARLSAFRPFRVLVLVCAFTSFQWASGLVELASAAVSNPTELIRDVPFQPGVTHVAGIYRFTDQNFLLEGADRAEQWGAQAIFVYLVPDFRTAYPDGSVPMWPRKEPKSLAQLVQTAPYKSLLQKPFSTYVFTAFSFANPYGFLAAPRRRQKAEEKEFYDLAKYLFATYQGTGKIFILKHWEGDWFGLEDSSVNANIPRKNIKGMVRWLSARQRGVDRARAYANAHGIMNVAVYNAVEVNRVLDVSELRLTRVLNAVVPAVKPDMVSYSSYDSMLESSEATDKDGTARSLLGALNTIDGYAPDPLGLGRRRIFISEFGLYENEAQDSAEPVWRAEAVLETAEQFGMAYAFLWQLYDNECWDASGEYIDESGLGFDNPKRPTNDRCRGIWLIRPDGSEAWALPVLRLYWPPQ